MAHIYRDGGGRVICLRSCFTLCSILIDLMQNSIIKFHYKKKYLSMVELESHSLHEEGLMVASKERIGRLKLTPELEMTWSDVYHGIDNNDTYPY